jgi:hypothetical protein
VGESTSATARSTVPRRAVRRERIDEARRRVRPKGVSARNGRGLIVPRCRSNHLSRSRFPAARVTLCPGCPAPSAPTSRPPGEIPPPTCSRRSRSARAAYRPRPLVARRRGKPLDARYEGGPVGDVSAPARVELTHWGRVGQLEVSDQFQAPPRRPRRRLDLRVSGRLPSVGHSSHLRVE